MNIQLEEIKNIKNMKSFCQFFAISEDQLAHFRKNKDTLFSSCKFPKRNGGYRLVYPIADDSYRNFLKEVSEILNKYYLYNPVPPPKGVHGFIKKKSIITNAQCHVQKKILLNLDIKNFFESISKENVTTIFVSIGFSNKHSCILSDFVTVNNLLATGFPTSPVLANIYCIQMDYVFEALCRKHDAVYTRYADDISISSNTSIPEKNILAKVLNEYGFLINENKYKISYQGSNQYVTGLTVCDKRPRLSRRLKRKIRLELYYIKKHGFTDHIMHIKQHIWDTKFTKMLFNDNGAAGYISFIYSIEPELAKKMWKTSSINKIREDFYSEV